MIDPSFHAELIHTAKVVVECLLGAAFLTFCWFMAPYVRGK